VSESKLNHSMLLLKKLMLLLLLLFIVVPCLFHELNTGIPFCFELTSILLVLLNPLIHCFRVALAAFFTNYLKIDGTCAPNRLALVVTLGPLDESLACHRIFVQARHPRKPAQTRRGVCDLSAQQNRNRSKGASPWVRISMLRALL
jgi:hypothetical protein